MALVPAVRRECDEVRPVLDVADDDAAPLSGPASDVVTASSADPPVASAAVARFDDPNWGCLSSATHNRCWKRRSWRRVGLFRVSFQGTHDAGSMTSV